MGNILLCPFCKSEAIQTGTIYNAGKPVGKRLKCTRLDFVRAVGGEHCVATLPKGDLHYLDSIGLVQAGRVDMTNSPY
jgi:hypothetical protein